MSADEGNELDAVFCCTACGEALGDVACRTCGPGHVTDVAARRRVAELEARLSELESHALGLEGDVVGLERDLRSKRATIKRLEREQDAALRASPHYSNALHLVERWRELCAPGAKEIGGRRLELAVARLKAGNTRDMLEQAIVGYSKFPYVVDGKRQASGPKSAWFADIELIFRGAKQVESGVRLFQRSGGSASYALTGTAAATEDPADISTLSWQKVRRANRKAIVDFIRDSFKTHGFEDSGQIILPCPCCGHLGDEAWNGRMWTHDSIAQDLFTCRKCGAGDEKVLEVIRANPGAQVIQHPAAA